jgi:ADP-ribose pyrophosphatase YjhB (NUDIX family)
MRARFPAAVHIFLMDGERILLLLRANTGYEDNKWGVVAGHIEHGESVTNAAIREAAEEVGIMLAPADLAMVGVMHRKAADERIDFFMLATNWQGTPVNMEPHRCSAIAWSPLARLPLNMVPYIRDALHNFQSGVWFAEHGWRRP